MDWLSNEKNTSPALGGFTLGIDSFVLSQPVQARFDLWLLKIPEFLNGLIEARRILTRASPSQGMSLEVPRFV